MTLAFDHPWAFALLPLPLLLRLLLPAYREQRVALRLIGDIFKIWSYCTKLQ